jgi:LPXTG-motif cell wall-anchored protein
MRRSLVRALVPLSVAGLAMAASWIATATVAQAAPQACQSATYGGAVTPATHVAAGWLTEDGDPHYVVDAQGTDGAASLQFSTPGANDKINYFHRLDAAPVPLAGIVGLAYTVRANTTAPQAAYDMEILTTGTGGYTTLVWEPYQQPGQGAHVNGTGQPIAYTGLENGLWWSTKDIPGDVGSGPSNQLPVPLSAIQAANPNAVIISYGIGQGKGNMGSESFVDDVTFLCGVANFEPSAPPAPTFGLIASCAVTGSAVNVTLATTGDINATPAYHVISSVNGAAASEANPGFLTDSPTTVTFSAVAGDVITASYVNVSEDDFDRAWHQFGDFSYTVDCAVAVPSTSTTSATNTAPASSATAADSSVSAPAATSTPTLASTGTRNTPALIGAGVLAVVLGGLLLLVSRRTRSTRT